MVLPLVLSRHVDQLNWSVSTFTIAALTVPTPCSYRPAQYRTQTDIPISSQKLFHAEQRMLLGPVSDYGLLVSADHTRTASTKAAPGHAQLPHLLLCFGSCGQSAHPCAAAQPKKKKICCRP
jgi:hypothetical protein